MYILLGIGTLIYAIVKDNGLALIAASIFTIADSIYSLQREIKKNREKDSNDGIYDFAEDDCI